MKEKISITLNDSLIKRIDSLIDRLIIRNRSQAIEVLLKKSLDRNKTAVILLGGPEEKLTIEGRYLPELNIGGIPMIERSIRKLRENNFREIFIIARKRILESAFGVVKEGRSYGVNINYVEEKSALGTADSLRTVKNLIKDTFLVIFGDVFFDFIKIDDLWDSHFKNQNLATLNLITYNNPHIKGVVFLEGNKILEFDQKPKKIKDNSYLVFSPIFICEPELLQYKGDSLEKEIFPLLTKKGLLNGYVSSKNEIHIHNKNDLEKLNLKFKE